MGGGKGGGSSSGGTIDPRAWEAQNKLADVAEKSFAEGQDVRSALMNQAETVLAGNYDPSTLPTYAPLYALGASKLDDTYRAGKENVESQYGIARQNTLGQMPTGGQLFSALADIERGRAAGSADVSYDYLTGKQDLSNTLSAGLVSDILNRGSTGAYSSMGAGVSGFGNSASMASQLAQSQLASNTQQSGQKAGLMGGLGQGLGTMYGLSSMGSKAPAATAAGAIGGALPF